MGLLSNVFDLITGKGSGIVGAGIGAVSSAIQNKKNRDWNAEQAEINRQFQSEEAETARLFNAHEAALQRDWSSQEAERARDWNEEMYEKYNSLSGKIHQAEQAGVNPMFAVTGNAVSPMATSSSAPSGASASGGAPSGSSATSSFVDLVGSMLGMAKLKAEIENIKADTSVKDAQKFNILKDTEWMDSLNQMSLDEASQRIAQSVAEIANTNEDTKLKSAEYGLVLKRIALADSDIKLKEQEFLVLVSEVAKNEKSLEVMSAQITEMLSSAGLNDERVKEVSKTLELLTQQYDHNAIVNGFDEAIKALEANDAQFWNTDNYSGAKGFVVRLIKESRSLLTFVKK